MPSSASPGSLGAAAAPARCDGPCPVCDAVSAVPSAQADAALIRDALGAIGGHLELRAEARRALNRLVAALREAERERDGLLESESELAGLLADERTLTNKLAAQVAALPGTDE